MPAKILTIAAGAPFAETLARGLIARLGSDPLALAQATIYLPTRRAGRTLSETFARVLGGAALLPNIRPLGDVDEDEFLFDPSSEDLSLPPVIAPIRRRLLLATLVQRWDSAQRGGALGFSQAAALARALARFLDEAQTQNADLAKLAELAPIALAEHWAEVRDFLELLRDEWPGLLAAENALDPADHRNQALSALARRFMLKPPDGPVIAAGSTGSIPATAELLGAIARLPQGAVVLPGLDRELDQDSWDNLDPGHPQYGMKQLLARIGVEREDVGDWQPAASTLPARETLLRETLRPAPTTDAWRAIAERGGGEIAQGLEGLSLIEAAHPGEEATTIALILREALETKGHTAALVTPDRNLARRVAAEMGRWSIAIDDSAGRPLAKTAPGAFLSLLAEAAESEFAPVPLLALLKHPLCAGGETPAEFRGHARELDRLVLRGPRPNPSLNGIATAILRAGANERLSDGDRKTLTALAPWFERFTDLLRPLEEAMMAEEIAIADAADIHAQIAEKLAATDVQPGADRLWRGDAGEAAASLLNELHESAIGIPPIASSAYPALFRELAEERAVRPAYGSHPRLAILGPLEARLQHFDVVALGGLNEGTWPSAAASDPWLSRPMRQTLGLEAPERAIGLAAHDFATLAAGPRVFFTRSAKVDGTPTVPSRWLQRLLQLTRGLKLDTKLESPTRYTMLAGLLSEPEKPAARMKRPAPRPPVAARPRRLSVTEIEKWLRDPYAIYARHVLGLKPLDPLDAEIGALERGNAVHLALERFLEKFAGALPDDAEGQLIEIADGIFREDGISQAVLALWRPRFARAAHWFIGVERERRTGITKSFVELRGRRAFPGPAGEFVLRCRADRIDLLRAGGAAIIDYKTGNPPSKKQVRTLLAPQLPLEGAILGQGGFAETGKIAASELLYIRFSGGADAGELRAVDGDIAALIKEAEEKLIERIAAFDNADTPYLPRLMPFRANVAGEYDHLARVREWSLAGWEEEE
jgi:ATP-dependent helicase/nuclease subunit B